MLRRGEGVNFRYNKKSVKINIKLMIKLLEQPTVYNVKNRNKI